MQGIEAGAGADSGNVEPRVTVDADSASAHGQGMQRAADAASVVSRALAAAGYEPRHLSVTSSESGELVLVARLDRHRRLPHLPPPSNRSVIAARLAIGLTLGVLLGFLGLPRLELPAANAPVTQPTPALPQILSVQDLAANNPEPPTPQPQPSPTATSVRGPLFDVPLTRPIPGWTNDPTGTAWFSSDGYHLLARDAGRFVATAIPLGHSVQDVVVSATFHKVGGPSGGGYGVILRDQGSATERDGRNQSGEYLVFEVGDRGDIGVWQRDQTHWIDIIPWQHSDAVHPDRVPNSVVVTAQGSNVQFQLNGATVANLSYDGSKLPTSGGLGVFVGGDLNEVALERLRIDNNN